MRYRFFLSIGVCVLSLIPFHYCFGWHVNSTHEAITDEAATLKIEIHRDEEAFRDWLDPDRESALKYFLTGVHDEDCMTINKGAMREISYNGERPKGPNGWGDVFQHFYDPHTGRGLWDNHSALHRAKSYETVVKNLVCRSSKAKYDDLTAGDKARVNDYFGRILHLIEDMGVSYHTRLESTTPRCIPGGRSAHDG